MTCRFPNACKKRDTRASHCASCAASIRNPKMWTPQMRADQSVRMRQRRAKVWDWLPAKTLKPEYLLLREKVGAAEAKRIILESYRAA